MKIAIIGTGYVGLVTGVSLANLGHKVICVGRNKDKISQINSGKSPFFEPGLNPLLEKLTKKRLINASSEFEKSVQCCDCTIIAVGTPTVEDEIDLSEIEQVSEQIGNAMKNMKKYHVVIVKSTVVPGTTVSIVKPLLEKFSSRIAGKEFGLCMVPEFLREGNAVSDATTPDRIVVGQYDKQSGKVLANLYRKVLCPKIFTNLSTAEMTKYAANALLATLISYSNEIARICEGIEGVDVVDVWKGVHLDSRLSPKIGKKTFTPGVVNYVYSGCGYGGSCFPKDTKALAAFAKGIGIRADIINSVININRTQPSRMIILLRQVLGGLKNKKIAVLGLAFKPDTDDLRESPSIQVVKLLLGERANVICHDPIINSERIEFKNMKVKFAKTAKEALKNTDGVLIMTAWEEYKRITPDIFRNNMRNPVVIDGRRIYDKSSFLNSEVIYRGIGYGG